MLIGKYKLESDSLNVILYKKHTTKKGLTTWEPIAYFSTPKNALEHLINLEVMETELVDLQKVVDKIEELHKLAGALKMLPQTPQST